MTDKIVIHTDIDELVAAALPRTKDDWGDNPAAMSVLTSILEKFVGDALNDGTRREFDISDIQLSKEGEQDVLLITLTTRNPQKFH